MPGDSKWPFWDGDPWPFQGLSDLQLGYKKVTLDHLVVDDYNWPVPWPSFGLAAHVAGQKSSRNHGKKNINQTPSSGFTALQKSSKYVPANDQKTLGFLNVS